MVLRNVWKVSLRKHALLGESGGMPPPSRKTLEFRTSEIASAGFSGQVRVAKIIHISSALLAIQLSRKLLLVHASFDRVLTLSHVALI